MKNGAFTGWKEVFAFTFEQNVKTKTFKVAFVSLSLLMFVVFFAINIGYGYYKNKDDKKEVKKEVNEINKLYLYSDFDASNIDFNTFKEFDEYLSNMDIIPVEDKEELSSFIEKDTKEEIKAISFELYNKIDSEECFEVLVNQSEECEDENVDKITSLFEEYFEEQKLVMAEIANEKIQFVLSENNAYAVNFTEADKSLGEILLAVFLPMIVILVMYMLILLHGQSISKNLMIEKNSKLMEMLLVSVKPYAIILGKVLAMYLIAVLEIVAWVISGILGYVVSNSLAKKLFDDFVNPIGNVIEMVQENSSGAFSTEAYILCILSIFLGFLAYCVLAGLITSNITKAEDLSNGSTVFQTIVVIAYLLAYLVPLVQSDSIIVEIMRYVPFTSAFVLPSDILIGNISTIGSVISLSILICSIIVMVIFTGKIYKKKVF